MNPYNSIQLVGTELVIVADPTVKNQVSINVIKDDITKESRIWGSINGKLSYGIPLNLVTAIAVYIDAQDKLWLDKNVVLPVTKIALTIPIPPPVSVSIKELALFNADTNQYIGPLTDAVVVSKLPPNVTINAICEPAIVGKVEFSVNGVLSKTELTSPYTLPFVTKGKLVPPFA